MSEPSVSYIAIGVVSAIGAGLVLLFFRLWGWLAERKLHNDDETRIKTVRLEERLAHHQPGGPARDLVTALTGLTSKLSDQCDRVVEAQSESSKVIADFSGQLAGMNARLTESLRLSEKRLDRIEERQAEHVTDRDVTRRIEAAVLSAIHPMRSTPAFGQQNPNGG